MKERGVLGGSTPGAALLQLDAKASSTGGVEAGSEENPRDTPAEVADLFRKQLAAWRNMAAHESELGGVELSRFHLQYPFLSLSL